MAVLLHLIRYTYAILTHGAGIKNMNSAQFSELQLLRTKSKILQKLNTMKIWRYKVYLKFHLLKLSCFDTYMNEYENSNISSNYI